MSELFLPSQNALPEWLIPLLVDLGIAVSILLSAVISMMLMVWVERRVVARMQDRLGPNRVGPEGILQSIADGVKMFTKEDVVPLAADSWVHRLAPIIVVTPVMLMFAVIPLGRGIAPTDFGTGALFALAVSSISAVGLMMAGWASSNKFALLGAMRAVAQLISYEIPAVLSVLGAVLFFGTMNLNQIANQQSGVPFIGQAIGYDLGLGWFVFTPIGVLGFGIFFICALAEGERTPFDIPEADSEIVAGHTTEYSGMKFALFFIGQYILNFALAMLASIFFLGGWQGPGVAQLTGDLAPLGAILSILYLLLKSWALFFVMVWIRGAFPRLRIDQLMDFAWKFLLPLALINLFSIAIWITIQHWGKTPEWTLSIGIGNVQLLGWLEQAPEFIRAIVGIGITAAINTMSFAWLIKIYQAPEEAEQEQIVTTKQATS